MNNKLVDRYKNFQQNKYSGIQNNTFIKSNNYDNISYLSEIENQKRLTEIKKYEKVNNLLKTMDKKTLTSLIIDQNKIKKENNKEIMDNYNVAKKDFNTAREKYWETRTNMPYKNIIRDHKYIDKFIGKKKLDNPDELIVHKVTKADKLGVKEKFDDFENKIKSHDKELKNIYSKSNLEEHKKKFEYNHIYKFRIKYKPSNHILLKKNNKTYYQNEQKHIADNKTKIDNILKNVLAQEKNSAKSTYDRPKFKVL
jgi:hypothetical protein